MTFSHIGIMHFDHVYVPTMYLFLPPLKIQNEGLHLF